MSELSQLRQENQILKDQRAHLLGEVDMLRQSLKDWAGPEATDPNQAKIRVILSGTQGFAFSDADVPLMAVLISQNQQEALAWFAKAPAEACAQTFIKNGGILAAPKIILPN